MKPKILMTLSAALTVFILLLVVGTVLAVNAGKAQEINPTPAPSQSAPAIDPQLGQAIIQRDAAYQAALAEANARLQKANETQRQMEEQIRTQQAAVARNAAPTAVQASSPVSLQEATRIAQAALGQNAAVLATRVVYLDGNPVYEITFAQGSLYVNESGAIVASQPAQASPPQAAQSEDESREHEDRD